MSMNDLTSEFIVEEEISSPIPSTVSEPYGGIAQDFREDTIFTLDIEAENEHPGTNEICHKELYSSFPYFRRLLSDEYMRNTSLDKNTVVEKTPAQLVLLHIDDRPWASITHYLFASKFIHAPEIYNKLCLDTGDPLSQMSATSIRMLFQKLPTPKDWIDRKVDTWRRALLAKFAQNQDLQRALILTGSAKLVNKQQAPQYLLMWVRTVLKNDPITETNVKEKVNTSVEMKDAVGYLEQIKTDEPPETFNRFLEIMTDFRSEKINTPQVLERVALLFKGKPWLIRNFLMFLPPGHISELSSSPESLIEITSPNGSKIEIDTNKGIVSFQQQQ